MTTCTVGSLFSGVGGFDLGFERAGFTTSWLVEIDPHAQSVLRRHWPGVPLYDDVRAVGAHNLAPVDVIIGGWPCQDHSVAGQRRGFAGGRSSLFWEFARIVAELRPRWLVAENVPGLLSQPDDFRAILCELDRLGYLGCWRVLNAQHFGVPQRRNRVYLVAGLGAAGERAAAVLFESEGRSRHPAPGEATGQGTAEGAGTGAPVTGGVSTQRVANPLGAHVGGGQRYDLDNDTFLPIAGGVTARYGKGADSDATDTLVIAATFDERNVTSRANRTRVEYGSPANTLHAEPLSVIAETVRSHPRPGSNSVGAIVSHTRQDPIHGPISPALDSDETGSIAVASSIQASAGHHGHSSPRGSDNLIPVQSVALRGRDGGGTAELGDCQAHALRSSQGGGDKPHIIAPTLTAPSGGGRRDRIPNTVTPAMAVRRLMPVECERLMGWPDDWTRYGADGEELERAEAWIDRSQPDEPIADSHRYRLIGNGVVAPVAYWIAKRLRREMEHAR